MCVKLYCETGALSPNLRQLQADGVVELVHFAFDPHSRTRKISDEASPAGAEWRDLDYSWAELRELGIPWADLKARGRIHEIAAIIGVENRRDVLHVNSAYLTGCAAMVSRDGDILDHSSELAALLGIQFFHPDRDADELKAFIVAAGAV